MSKNQSSFAINDPSLVGNYMVGNVSSNNQPNVHGYSSGMSVSSNAIPYTWANGTNSMSGKLELEGEGADIKINGKSLRDFMDTMEKRLAILVPDPAKLEKYEALKKAYDHYILMEKLIGED
jgi:hypothetical protein